MTYHLSPQIITDTIHALAAVQSLALPEEERSVLAPLLDRERQGIQTHIVRNAFATVAMELGPLVLDISLDGETANNSSKPVDPAAVLISSFSITLLVPDTFTATRHGIVRRALEQAIAMRAMADWCLTLPASGSPLARSGSSFAKSGSSLAATFLSLASRNLATLQSALAPTLQPCIRP